MSQKFKGFPLVRWIKRKTKQDKGRKSSIWDRNKREKDVDDRIMTGYSSANKERTNRNRNWRKVRTRRWCRMTRIKRLSKNFTNESSVPDPWHFGVDPDQDQWIHAFDSWIRILLFSSLTFKRPTNNKFFMKFFCLLLAEGTVHLKVLSNGAGGGPKLVSIDSFW